MVFKNKTNFKFFGIFLILVSFLFSGFGCKILNADQQNAIKPITINYWRAWDDQDAFDEIIKDYQAIHPNITIKYKKFRFEEFEKELLDALAEDRGPDIFSIPQSWLYDYQTKLAPLPENIKMGYIIEKNYFGIKKEQVIEIRTNKTPTLRQIKETYADTVYNDVVIQNQVYGLPLSLPTLIMFYNRTIINQAGISQIPTDWKAFQEAVKKATKFEADDKILQAGTALGTGFNIDRSFDIISVLMMQNGAQMTDSRGYPTLFNQITIGNQRLTPGLTALQFYADFASPIKDVFSWDNTMPGSLEAFLSGKVGFFFGYNYHLPQIRSRSRIDFGIAPIPQIAGNPKKNYANYWLEVVSKKSQYPNEAWDFVLFMNKPEEVRKFLAKTGYPTSQKQLIQEQTENEDLYPASTQTLTAGTWYRGKNSSAAEQAMKELLEEYLLITDPRQISDLLSKTMQKIVQTMN